MSKHQDRVEYGVLHKRNFDRIDVGTEEWFDWLEGNNAFRFEHDGQSFSARKESPIKRSASDNAYGDGLPEYDESKAYWQAYRKVEGKTRKRYIGKSKTLTHDRLIEISKALDEPAAPKPAKELPTHLDGIEATKLTDETFRARNNYDEAQKTIDRLEEEKAELHNKLRDCQAKLQTQESELHNKLRDCREECRLATLNTQNLEKKIELLEEQVATFPSEIALATSEPAINLPDLNEVRDRVLKNWRVVRGAESKERIRQALDSFIKHLQGGQA